MAGSNTSAPATLAPNANAERVRAGECYSSAMLTNVLGTELKCCCRDPLTGFYRDGYCRTGPEDLGLHTVCVLITREFLDFSVLDGNDLVTPHPEWGFPG